MAKYHCTYCQNPINSCRIHCTECTDFDLCLQCFACGAESGDHRKEHDYEVDDDGFIAVYDDSDHWAANEEDALLDAVEQYGFGNWEDVGKYVKTRSVEECRGHYYIYYIHGNIGKVTLPKEFLNKIVDHTCTDSGPLSPSLTRPVPPVDLTPQEATELGYMPLRDDFEREYDNEAESLVSGLNLHYDDDDLDIAYKLTQIDIYRQRLKERLRRKKIARDYCIIQQSTTEAIKNKAKTTKKKSSRDERDFHEKMRVFAQFHATGEHKQFFENLKKEKQLKCRIKELMRYRRNGIIKLDECQEFDMERLRREKRKEQKKKMLALQGNSGAKQKNSSSSMASKTTTPGKRREDDELDGTIGDVEPTNGFKGMSTMPGYDILSCRERRLCHSIGMRPASYVTIKTCIIKDYVQRRQGMPVKIRYPSHLDKTHRRKILSFLSENGWIGGVTIT